MANNSDPLLRLPSPDELKQLLPYLKPHERERLLQSLSSRIDGRFCPHAPYQKQQLFLSIDDREAMFGGAAGGGKSDALLMAFLQYVDQPHYRGLILRRRSVDLERSDAILDRAKAWWLGRRSGVRYFAGRKTFQFPSGAEVQFGHLNNEDDKLNYQGGAWHFIAFDELTQFTPTQYLYLFGRLRRVKSDDGRPPIPLRIRSATNPGGPSHYFVRDRFMTLDYARAFLDGNAPSAHVRECVRSVDGETERGRRWFVPSKIVDNPALDRREYVMALMELDEVTKGQLLDGNWLITAAGRFRPEWFRRFRHPDLYATEHYQLLGPGGQVAKAVHPLHDCFRITIIDAAGTEAERAAERRGKAPSWTVISTFDITHEGGLLIWREVDRFQREFPDVVEACVAAYHRQRPQRFVTEFDGIGKQLYQTLQRRGLPIEAISSEGRDKLTRSAAASTEAKEGRIYLPESAGWLDELEAELFVWTGLKDEQADQIDTLSYAAKMKVDGIVGAIELDGGGIMFGGR